MNRAAAPARAARVRPDEAAGGIIQSRRLCSAFRGVVALVAIVAAVFQSAAFSDSGSFIVVMIALAGLLVPLFYAVRPTIIRRYPVSTVALLGLPLLALGMPLVGMSIEFQPLNAGLKRPVETFSLCAATSILLVLAHLFYRNLPSGDRLRAQFQRYVSLPCALIRPPSAAQIWLIGGGGFLATLVIHVLRPGGNALEPGAFVKLIEGIMPLAYMPFLLLVPRLYGSNFRPKMFTYLALGVYFMATLAMALVQNSRLAAFLPLAAIGIAYIVGFLTGVIPWPKFSPPAWIAITVAAVILLSALPEFARAMRLIRKERGTASPTEMIALTLEKWSTASSRPDSSELRVSLERGGQWDETYFKNEVLNRLSMLKFHDNAIYFCEVMGEGGRAHVRNFIHSRTWSAYPTPLLRLFPFHVDKALVSTRSLGDYMFYLATGYPYTAFRTGSHIGSGYIIYGWMYAVILFTIAVAYFFLSDTYVLQRFRNGISEPVISVVALCSFYGSIQYFNLQESYAGLLYIFLRGFLQTALLYAISFHVSAFLLRQFMPANKGTRA